MSDTLWGSVSNPIRALEIGRSTVPRVVRLDGNCTNKTDIAQMHEQFHRDISPILYRLRKGGMNYTMEQFITITRSGDFIVGLCVTRTE